MAKFGSGGTKSTFLIKNLYLLIKVHSLTFDSCSLLWWPTYSTSTPALKPISGFPASLGSCGAGSYLLSMSLPATILGWLILS